MLAKVIFTESRFKGGITIARTRTVLELICARVIAEQLTENPERAILLHCEGSTEGEWDPVRMEQVVSNLVSNALAHGAPAGPVEVTLRAEGEDVVLRVANEGEPIPTDVLGTIFEPFRRGSTPGRGGRRGLGLGLYIVRQIVLGHGGSVGAESTTTATQRGTVFTVKLPRNAA